jgi:hypothetical protein
MPLKIFENSLEKVSPAFHGEYEKQPDGSYVLKLIDLNEHVAGLKSALRKSREEIKELRAAGGMPDSASALTPFGEMLKVLNTRKAPDVRAGLLPRRGTPQRGS